MSEADIYTVLTRPYSARLFGVIVVLILAVLFLCAHVLLPALCGPWCASEASEGSFQFLIRLCDDLFAAIFVTVGIAFTVFRLLPPVDRQGTVEAIAATEIARIYEEDLKKTPMWHFKGGTGTYLRSNTLPAMARYARQLKVDREVKIEVIDPFSEASCEGYAAYRRTFASGYSKDRELWTAQRVRNEIFATVITAALLNQKALRIVLGFSPGWSSFRFDASSEHILVTNEDPTAPALRSDKDTNFYRFFLKELRISLEQARLIDLRSVDLSVEDLGENEALSILANSLPSYFGRDTLSSTDLKSVLRKVKNPINYYER